jgi:hypothetical protein
MIKAELIILFIILILIICFIAIKCINYNKYGGGQKHIKQMSSNLYAMSIEPMSATKGQRFYSDLYAMSYTISGEGNGLDFSQLRKLLNKECTKNGVIFIETPLTKKVHISFGSIGDFIINGKLCKGYTHDPAFFKQKAAIKNVLGNIKNLTDKSKLYNTIQKLMPTALKYLPNSYLDKEFERKINASNMFQNTIYIVKKDNANRQKGVIIITSKEEYYVAKKKLHKLEIDRVKLKKVKPSYEIIINEYITNALLIDGKKFHLRVLFLLSVISGITRCSVFSVYEILTAKKPYIKSDWFNREIHLSGSDNTEKLHKYPEDLQKEYPEHFSIIEKNLNACNKTICMIMTIANIKNYPESYSGYHLYGADIMLTDKYHPYLLEINKKPGLDQSGETINWDEYNKQFSYKLCSFILNSTSFPALGIKRPPIYDAEFIEKGALTPFGKILIGDNKCFLIPYLDANEAEITAAAAAAITDSSHINIFLIAKSIAQNIIGYLALDNHHYLKIFIIENYRNQEIGTAMIAQFLEIHYMRYYTAHNTPIVKIKKTNTFLDKIAKKLHFHINADHFEYNFLNKI